METIPDDFSFSFIATYSFTKLIALYFPKALGHCGFGSSNRRS
jgi:hypothetical protein